MGIIEQIKKELKKIKDDLRIIMIKRQIKQNKENSLERQISYSSLDSDLIYKLLQDKEIVEQFCNKGNILYLILSMADKAKIVNFLEDNIDILNDEQKLEFIKYAKLNITPKELVQLNFGKKLIKEYPKELYGYLANIETEGLEELFNNYTLNGAGISQLVKDSSIPNNIKKAILRFSTIGDYAEGALLENEVLNNKEYIEILKSRIPHDKIENFIRTYLDTTDTVILLNRIPNVIKIWGNKFSNLIEDKEKAKLVKELYANFNEEEIYVLTSIMQIQDNSAMFEMNFFKRTNIHPNILQEIIKKDGNLRRYKRYLQFRNGHTNLDFAENIMKTLTEYTENIELYQDMMNNISQVSLEEAEQIMNNYHQLMQMENKFGVKTFKQLQVLDEIEEQYYRARVETNNIEQIKKYICEILTKNSDIKKLVQLRASMGEDINKDSYIYEILDIISVIQEINNIDDLRNIFLDCINLIGTKELKDFRELSQNMEEKLVNEYRKEYVESLSNYEDLSNQEIAGMEGIAVNIINEVKVIELNGIPFNLIVHIGNIDGNASRTCCSYLTQEQYGTFGTLETSLGAVYNKIEPSRIKYICGGDKGYSRYRNEYVTSENLVAMTENSKNLGNTYNEVTLATRKTEKEYDNGKLMPSAFATTAKIGSEDFYKLLADMEGKEQKVLYVINDDIYKEKQRKRNEQRKVYEKEYIQTLSPKVLNKLLLTVNGDYKRKDELIQTIISEISKRVDDKIEKKVIKANIRRYEELVNYKGEKPQEVQEFIKQLNEILLQKDNEIIIKIEEDIKSVIEKSGDKEGKYEGR